MKTQAQQTPTPWSICTCFGAEYKSNGISALYLKDQNGVHFASITGQTDEEKWANATSIVRAVNAHEEMVSLLKTMYDMAGHDIMLKRRISSAIARAKYLDTPYTYW